LNGPGGADQVVNGAEFEKMGCPVITDCLQGRLTGVVFKNGVPYSTRSLSRAMEIIVDGMTVDADFLSNLIANQIESIEVLRSAGYTSIYGGRGNGGVLVITTKRGGADNNVQRYAPGVITYSPKGFHKIREFYSPQYDNPKTNPQVPDLRSTIFWKPNVATGKEGKTSFEFFNADTKGTYRVVVEGIDEDGNIGRQVYRYKVE
jgi:TonB-dependent SusC/RagA subfamily outer membrane receptor